MHAPSSASGPASETPSGEGSAPARAGCVLLLPPNASSPPTDLRDALARRGLAPRGAADCHLAMAGMIRAAIASRTLEGASAGRGEALIIVEPDAHPPQALDDLLASLDKFLPRAAVWSYAADAAPRLQRLERARPEVVVKRDAVRQAADAIRNGMVGVEPTLRLHRDEDDPPASPAPAEPSDEAEVDADAGEGSLLSAEELSMLLADDEADEQERPR